MAWASIDCSTGVVASFAETLPVVMPTIVSPQQLRQALRKAGLKAAFDAHVALQSEAQQENWKYGRRIRRGGTLTTGDH